ncbi:MAG: UTP--glucose-1-phosphate uridylyltransferase GalU [Thermoplasmatota archaeon]
MAPFANPTRARHQRENLKATPHVTGNVKAVIPAAGLGTRFLPATKNMPKEMLPLIDKPAIQYVVEEAVASGVTDILIITGRGKRAIEDHFDRNYELEQILAAKGDTKTLAEVQHIAEMADIHYVRQKETKGLGHAVWVARKHIGNEPFVVLLGDDVVFSETPCAKQLLDRFKKHRGSVIAVEKVPPERIEGYGVVKVGAELERHLYPIQDLVEKPKASEAPSDLGILGRYVLTPEIFDALEHTPPGKNGEIQLTDALRRLKDAQAMYAYAFEGKRYDLGNKLEWLKTNVEVALMREDFRKPLLDYLRRVVKE